MSMHLVGPWLTTGGKKKSKQKYRNSEQAKKARELESSWEQLLSKHGETSKKEKKSFKKLSYLFLYKQNNKLRKIEI
jgi:hypothetical protein